MHCRLPSVTALLGLCLFLPSSPAFAHFGGSDSGLLDGLMHPVFGPDHLLAMISVGVVSAQLGGSSIWRIPATFVCAMVAGGALGITRYFVPHAEVGIALSVLVLGLGIVFAHRGLPAWPVSLLVFFFGALHGYLHGMEIPGSVSPALYTVGFVLSTAALHIFGVIIGELATLRTWLWKSLRVTGSLVALAGVVFVLEAVQ
jgi:urease accessory protein